MNTKCYPSKWRETALLLALRLAGVFSQSSEVDTSTEIYYPLCTGTSYYIGNGDCNSQNNNAGCGWDEGDCCGCTCEDGSFHTCGPDFDCLDPSAWCRTGTAAPTSSPTSSPISSCTGVPAYIADGDCDTYNNNAGCSYDGGDCCDCTCEDSSAFTCGPDFDCQDPGAGCPTTTPTPAVNPAVSPTSTCAEGSDYIADGDCDTLNNNAGCDYDGGDCCECTCEDGPLYTCGPYFDDCDDPRATCNYPAATPSPLGGRSLINPAEPTPGSTSHGISTPVVASVCVAGVIFIGIVAFCARRWHIQHKNGGARDGGRTPANNRPPPTVPSQTSGQGTGGVSVEQGGQVNTVVGPFPVRYNTSMDAVKAGTGADMTPPPCFEDIAAGPFNNAAIEPRNPTGSATRVPEGVLVPPSYEQTMKSAGQ